MNATEILSTQTVSNRRLNPWQHSPLAPVASEGDRVIQGALKLD